MDISTRTWRARALVGDSALALGAWFGAVLLRIHVPMPLTEHLLPPDRLPVAQASAVLVVGLQVLLLYFFGWYHSHEPQPRLQLALRIARPLLLVGLGVAGYFFFLDRQFPRSVVVLFMLLDLPLVIAWRSLLQRYFRPPRRRVVIVGGGPGARELAATIDRHHWHGLEVVGFVQGPDDVGSGNGIDGEQWLGTLEDLPRLMADEDVDAVILATSPYTWEARLVDRLALHRPEHVSVLLLPGPFESLIGRMRYRWVNDLPLIEVVGREEWRLHRPVKRALDLTLGSVLLVLSLPLMAACAAAVRLSSPGPVLYRQERLGRGRRTFTLLKFRTMVNDAERDGERLAVRDDPRVTRVGALLRRTRLDELPQLVHVVRGTMSLVGPRPERESFVRRFLDEVPGYAERFTMAPGLTGLAQVNGEYDSSAENKLRYDLAYMANWSLWLDLSILFRTIRIVLSSKGV